MAILLFFSHYSLPQAPLQGTVGLDSQPMNDWTANQGVIGQLTPRDDCTVNIVRDAWTTNLEMIGQATNLEMIGQSTKG